MRRSISKASLAVVLSKYVGQPFKAGGNGEADGGWGCLNLCLAVLQELGKADKIPLAFGNITLENYFQVFPTCEGNTDEVKSTLLAFLNTIGTPVEIHNLQVGDALMIKIGRGAFPAIYVGAQNVISSFVDRGVSLAKIDFSNVLIARRFSNG